jgi:glycosyltransferase involved in cell wall biosynthesis
MMKVLLVWKGAANEEERSVLARREVAFLRELAAQEVRVFVALCGDDADIAADLRDAHAAVHVVPVALPPAAAAVPRLPLAAMHLRRLIAEVRPDVVESTEVMPAIAAGLAALGRNHTRAVIYRRQHGGGQGGVRLASRLAARLADRTIVSSELMRSIACVEDGSRPDQIDVATTGTVEPVAVDDREVLAARRSLGISDSAVLIGVVSRLRYEKGIDILIRSLDAIGVGGVQVVILGSGPEEMPLRALAASARVPVHFLGHRDDVALWLQAADVIAIPSRRESFGRVTLEAMAVGKPIVAARVGGLAEAITDGETGLLIPPENEGALALALRTIITDRTLAARLGAAARERCRSRYTIPRMTASRRAAWERTLASTTQR